MDPVSEQYETYPYPERDPADETRRLVTGSPSAPREIDHFLFRGARDWSQPFRVLCAGGGTGDGTIQIAQLLADAGCPAEITWLDPSRAARGIAEERARIRGLDIRFVTGPLEEAPALGQFDYIDCCGVLHHLETPQAGFDALAKALAPEGGMGLMVYAPYGRTGVYALQSAFGRLLGADAASEKPALAREVLKALPEANWFRHNRFVTDHQQSDAGLYDLLLHSRDVPFTVSALGAALEEAGLGLVSMLEPARYDPLRYLPEGEAFAARVKALAPLERMALAEELAGDIRLHVAYATHAERAGAVSAKVTPDAVPRLVGLPPKALAETVAKRGGITIDYAGVKHRVRLPPSAARLIALADGRPLGEIARAARLDWFAFAQAWAPVHAGLTGFNKLNYSRTFR
ncbi:bifunctional 2-polyprenyl-6-hydroxyphenol methylase/3-demethylubiquinol 3-O-methyltransferase UbiG [Oceanicella sp. SM1341]|uniref:class I SAM-dependent methyltransferase n=1 Tax=Oceanicella sp. SM1341 TaxID=1548889 RepID=UPI000E4F7F37|nr:class I SAM-dependent methyltransferase [Oceanicella sp. SM1341]